MGGVEFLYIVPFPSRGPSPGRESLFIGWYSLLSRRAGACSCRPPLALPTAAGAAICRPPPLGSPSGRAVSEADWEGSWLIIRAGMDGLLLPPQRRFTSTCDVNFSAVCHMVRTGKYITYITTFWLKYCTFYAYIFVYSVGQGLAPAAFIFPSRDPERLFWHLLQHYQKLARSANITRRWRISLATGEHNCRPMS